jgi:hypothetical protein
MEHSRPGRMNHGEAEQLVGPTESVIRSRSGGRCAKPELSGERVKELFCQARDGGMHQNVNGNSACIGAGTGVEHRVEPTFG